MVPFISLIDHCAYSILFPKPNDDVHIIRENAEVTIDYVEGPEASSSPLIRSALLLPWIHKDFTDLSWKQEEPDPSFFSASRTNESIPDPNTDIVDLPKDRKIKVYAEYEFIGANLTHPRFEMVDNMAEADILWLSSHFKEYK